MESYPVLFLFLWICTVLSFIYARLHLRSRGVFHALTAANVLLAFSPAAVAILLAMGGSNVAQLSGNMNGWRFWLSVFPILGMSAFAALCLTIGASIFMVRMRRNEGGVFLCYFVPTLLLSLWTLYGLGQFAPDA